MDNLRENLLNFKKITESLINEIKEENYNSLEDIFNKREIVINTIKKIDYNLEDFKNISSELKLLEMERELNILINEKRQFIVEEINKLKTYKRANNNYQKNFKPDSIFFSKKI
ncbi:hypothetical protein SAMN05428976_10134 [Clostridium sp. USBA 49]|uniref:flagellar protein FliT n=1 Tax=Clostridium TaxID=1485 RepID=UPI0009992AFF|nr:MULTISPECIES: flagellar protein FliT [Clostridium]SKA72706.1 hypothetical protein SAMN05428976_10134 [Clostridium sp. USBA 49]